MNIKKVIILIAPAILIGAAVLGGNVFAKSLEEHEGQTEQSVNAEIDSELRAEAGEQNKDIYSIGSISKVYTSVAVMKLCEEGKLNLDEPVITYLPEFTMQDERYKDITVRMLLNHSSGLMGMTEHNAMTIGKGDTGYHDTILAMLKTQKLKANPGEYGVYCNDGFTIAELLIERVSKMSYSEYLDEYIWKPLGLTDTGTPVYHYQENRIADTYVGFSKLPNIECHLLGSGGIYSTAYDTAAFGQIFTQKGQQILSKESLDEIMRSYTDMDSIGQLDGDKQMDFGLGWDCVNAYPYSSYGIKALTKGGSIIFQNSSLVVLPEENISAAMIVSGGSGDEATYALQDLILNILEEEGIIEKKDLSVKAETNVQSSPLPEEMRDYAGYYMSNQLLKVTFSDEGNLILQSAEGDYDSVQEYAYVGNGIFKPLDGAYLDRKGTLAFSNNGNVGDGTLGFREESNGKTYIYGSSYETVYGLGETASTLIFAEKVEDAGPGESVMEEYRKRDGEKYFLIDSVYNSWSFYMGGIFELKLYENPSGYISDKNHSKFAKIIDENNAENKVDLPVVLGRDLATYEFSKKDDYEQMKVSTLTYVSKEALQPISELPAQIKMTKSEDVRWYRITEDYVGKSIQIQVPKQGGFYLYDQDGECIASSVAQQNYDALLLPQDGYLLLAGEAGNEFQITYGTN